MAKQGWIGSVALAVGAAAGTAAAQFGLGYGLGIIAWSPAAPDPGTPDNIWLASLAWTLWISATSTVVGAICADRRSAGEIGAAPPRPTGSDGNGPVAPPGVFATAIWRALLAVSAAVGALISVALVLVPARAAIRADTATPQLIAAGYAIVGITVGIVIAVCALAARAATVNVIATAGWLWLLAIAAVINGVAVGRGLGTAPLEVWPFGEGTYFRATWSIEGATLMLGAALIIGAASAWPASRRGDNRVGVALSGVIGPLLVAVAYFLTVPRLVGVHGDPQFSAYLVAPYAVIAGLAGSVLLVAATTSRDAAGSHRSLLPAVRPRDTTPTPVAVAAPAPAPAPKAATGKASVVSQPTVPTTDPSPAAVTVSQKPAAVPAPAPAPRTAESDITVTESTDSTAPQPRGGKQGSRRR